MTKQLPVNYTKVAEDHLAKNDRTISNLITKYGSCTITPNNDFYNKLNNSIISQQLSVKAASTIYKRFQDLFGGLSPKPEQILETDDEDLRSVGCSYAKIRYIKDLALHIVEGRLDLKRVSELPNSEVIDNLTAVKGIGEWSAHMFMIFSLGRLDVLPTGDLGIKKGIMNLYGFDQLPTPAQVKDIAISHSWHPYESVASWYMWKSLDNK